MFRVNNENTRTTSVNIFHTFSSVFIVDFEQVSVSWGEIVPDMTKLIYFVSDAKLNFDFVVIKITKTKET